MILVMDKKIRFNVGAEQSIVDAVKGAKKGYGDVQRNVTLALLSYVLMSPNQRAEVEDCYNLARSRAKRNGTLAVEEAKTAWEQIKTRIKSGSDGETGEGLARSAGVQPQIAAGVDLSRGHDKDPSKLPLPPGRRRA